MDRVSYDVEVGVSPALAFAREWQAAHPDDRVGLIPCAMGGSSIADWKPNRSSDSLYGSMLKRSYAARSMGEFRGLLFLQGESDAISGRAEEMGG